MNFNNPFFWSCPLKYTFESVSRSTSFFRTTIFAFGISLLFLIPRSIRSNIISNIRTCINSFPAIVSNCFLGFTGNISSVYVVSLVPVTVVKSISATQSIFVLFFAIICTKLFPHFCREKIDYHSIMKKLVLFSIIIIGIVMVVA